MTVEQIGEVALQVTAFAGAAKSSYIGALQAAKKGYMDECLSLIEAGDASYTDAHHAHNEVLTSEMESGVAQITLFMAHAEDQLMSAETIKILVTELIEIYEARR